MGLDPARLAEQFIRRMDARGVHLDYAPHTLAFLPLRGADLSGGLALELAAYYGEVVRRHLGGRWELGAEPSPFPRLRVAQDLVILPLESAQQVAEDEPEALAREFGEIAMGLERPSPEVFEDAGGLLLRWLAMRGRLPVPLLEALRETPGTAGQVFRTVLGGRLTSTEVTLEADRFLRGYVRAAWPEDLASVADGRGQVDDSTFVLLVALLDRRWDEWHAAGCPTAPPPRARGAGPPPSSRA
jgi:hypothetical protein